MDKPIYRFFISLFEVFITYIVFANFLGWSGGAISITGYSDVDWTNSYVGFESLRIAVNDFGNSINGLSEKFGISLDFQTFLKYAEGLLNVMLGGFPKFLTQLAEVGKVSWVEVAVLLVTLLLQPLFFLVYFVIVLGFVFMWATTFLVVVLRFVGGAYNIPFEDTSDIWEQWSYLSSEWDWSNIPSSVLIPRAL